MKKTMKVELGGKKIVLALNFNALEEISNEVCDAFEIVREEMTQAMLLQAGVPYEPKFKFTVGNVPEILYIAHKNADGEMSRDELRELSITGGMMDAKAAVVEYLGAAMNSDSQEITADEGTKPEKK